ncbi:MAG: N-acylglucosamine 2-epimerase [Microbacteriaceae bacterium]|nr:N-acylglucosamine 2-epimerase [Microbacteriaceae bacterium]
MTAGTSHPASAQAGPGSAQAGRSAARLQLEQVLLPWWDGHGADDVFGGVLTCFSNRGELQSTEKYIWSQGRWAWLCAEIARDCAAGLLDADSSVWSKRAIQTAQFLLDHALLDDGHTVFRVSERGDALVSGAHGELSTSVFADLFVALGLAGAARLPECPENLKQQCADAADAILASASRRIKDRTAASEPYPVPDGFSDMAGPMTLLHVGSEVSRLGNSNIGTVTFTEALAELVSPGAQEPMWAQDRWWEFRPDAAADVDTVLARHKTPGHLLECIWMVVHAADAAQEPVTVPAWLPDLAIRALELGWDERDGGLFRYVDQDGGEPRGRSLGGDRYETLVQTTWDTKLWWVQTEAMYATALLAKRFARDDLAEWNRRITDYTLATFPDPAGQEWIQIRDRSGHPFDQVVALPVKDPFHIARSLLLLNRLEHPHHTEGVME